MAGQMKDISNQRFGRLVALRPVGRNRQKCIIWECACDCGEKATVSGAELRALKTRSCGCLASEVHSKSATTHGLSDKNIYATWRRLRDRCFNPKNDDYVNYGGRGISVCEEWRGSVEAFHAYVSQLPHYGVKGYSIDRVDNDSDYKPGNVRWATIVEQNRNKRTCRMIEFGGKSQTVSEWASELNILDITLGARLRRGWPIDRALTVPVRIGATTNGS